MYSRSKVHHVHAVQQGRPIRGRTDSIMTPSMPVETRATPTLGDFIPQDERLTAKSSTSPAWNMPFHRMAEQDTPTALGRAPSTSSSEDDHPMDLSGHDFPPLESHSQIHTPPMTEMPIDSNINLLEALLKEEEFLNRHFPNRQKIVIKASDLWQKEVGDKQKIINLNANQEVTTSHSKPNPAPETSTRTNKTGDRSATFESFLTERIEFSTAPSPDKYLLEALEEERQRLTNEATNVKLDQRMIHPWSANNEPYSRPIEPSWARTHNITPCPTRKMYSPIPIHPRIVKESELVNEELFRPLQGRVLSADATPWYPPPNNQVPPSEAEIWDNKGEEATTWPPEMLERAPILQGSARTITKPLWEVSPTPRMSFDNKRPQFGIAQHMKVKVPSDDLDYKTIKPALHGYFSKEET
ncbi:hypothetical protein QAD02_003482 [Eretmocerus hayati]|uniref:Uncharacterized protein n=2 Tax=Eretmocerus hayati TaxID=131215 RepID=A0ACC2N6P6_9HYME|nr:hypothetical protein QAD02_008055 [Eretmocerus hayati]KAJ8672223.1 hypothetical protein QAD02_003482 [Eretmocerus hayati]